MTLCMCAHPLTPLLLHALHKWYSILCHCKNQNWLWIFVIHLYLKK
ncbi:hypothetical protein EGK_01131 [Macaca mulatta]|uniref:Uncharacterized protein n=2 Tax=Macaca TaxID=9539 RepID=F7EQX1_MACMU|nr:hypothetical protein EGK_01131 [Macaca mulatta]EHH50195.1 hypothetical protein EGM_00982 [Macaca fascicularis]